MFVPGERVVVGCSGGADSSCLLHVLASGLPELGLSLTAVYVDHGLRQDTRAEREWVERLAQSLGVEYVGARVDVAARVRTSGESVQEAARKLRYAALRQVAEERRASKIAVGHTRTDQAETVLMQVIRGTGIRGLGGIAPVLGEIVRPLLWISREETQAYCRAHGLEYVDDPSNASDIYLRNRIRSHLLPLLSAYNPEVERHLAQLAEIAREEDAFLAREAERAAQALFTLEEDEMGTTVRLDGKALMGLSRALARRVIRLAHGVVAEGETAIDFEHVERILERADECRGTIVVGRFGGVEVRNEYGRLHFVSAGTAPAAPVEERALAVPGETSHARFALRFQARIVDGPLERVSAHLPPGPNRALLDWEKIAPPLTVRSRKAGDRIRPLGLDGSKKVKEILIDAKVPRDARDRVPVVADAEGVVWVVGYALSERARADATSRKILCLDVLPIKASEAAADSGR